MIRVTVDMWPQGDEHRKYRLGSLDISNTGLNMTKRRGDYGVRVYSKSGAELIGRKGAIANWPRLSRPVLSLVRRALETAGF